MIGESDSFDGVYGVSNTATAAGVSGHNEVGGWGVWASGRERPQRHRGDPREERNGNGVEGTTDGNPIFGDPLASGVYGENTGVGYGVAGRSAQGIGLLGDSASGWALDVSGNATQSRPKGGLVKAMAYIDAVDFPSTWGVLTYPQSGDFTGGAFFIVVY